MKEKKVAVMTIRMTPGTKQAIEREAELHDWTPSKMAEKILSAWASQRTERNQTNEEQKTGQSEIGKSVAFHNNEIGTIHIQ